VITAQDLYRECVAGMARIGGDPPSFDAHTWIPALNSKLKDLNRRSFCYWRRVKFQTLEDSDGYGLRYARVDPTGVASGSTVTGYPMAIIRAAISLEESAPASIWPGTSTKFPRELSVQPTMQFSGLGHTVSTDGTENTPNCVWLDFDPGLGWYLVGLDPRPDQVYWVHCAIHYPIPAVTDAELPLPILPHAEPVLLEGMLAYLTEGDADFHRKSFHDEHLVKYETGVQDMKRLVNRTAFAGQTATARVGRGPQRDWGN